jgi:hypothetical protein
LSRRAFAGSVASGAVVAGVPAVARPAAASSPRGGFAFQTTGTSIGDLPAGVNPDGTEKLPAIQGGSGVSLATDQIAMRAKHLLASDAGAAAFSNTATATMVLSKLYPNLMPGDTLAVGDVIEIEAWGSYVNNSGAERTLQLRAYFRYPERRNPGVELTNLGGVNLVSNASNRYWFVRVVMRMTTVGAAGAATVYADHAMSSPANFGTDTVRQTRLTSPTALDTTRWVDINVTAQMSTADATQTVTPRGVIVRKTPA